MTRSPGRDVPPDTVREHRVRRPPALVHPAWAERFPWLAQGTTTRGDGTSPFDLALFGEGGERARAERHWGELGEATGIPRWVHARQPHGSRVRAHAAGPAGLELAAPCDGHVTAEPGVLLAVTTADCVPVFLVDPGRRAVGVAHAGWRGAAAGVLEAAVGRLADLGADVAAVHVHLGPAICGACYEVGPEVFAALGRPEPEGPRPIDLRRILSERAQAVGVPAAQITISAHCTRCTGSGLFSHRAGDAERQVGYVAIRPEG